jgi:hypothetical protein
MQTLRWTSAILLCAAQFLARPAAQTSSPPVSAQPDIIGLRLGMTEPEAVAVLRAFNPAVRIRTVTDTLPTAAATRFTATLYAGFYGDERAGIGDEVVKLAFSNPTPMPRVIGIWRKQLFPQGRELAMANTAAAIRDKYGAPLFTHVATGQTTWVWGTGVNGRQPPGMTACSAHQSAVNSLDINIVSSGFIEPRAYFHAPDCGIAINVMILDVRGLVTTIGTSLVDYAAGVRVREELEVMSRRPDNRAIEAEQRGKPKL